MTALVRRGDLVFDVGANIGAKAEQLVGLGAEVVCFEPQPRCVEALRRRFQGQPRVTIIDQALAAQPGRLQLSICSAADTISTFSESWKSGRFANFTWDRTLEVEVSTLDAMIDRYGVPRYCKIDVEGFEKDVLAGLSRAVPYLSFEFACEFLDATEACLARLQSLGFRRFQASLGESRVLLDGPWLAADALLARLRALTDPLAWGDVFATTEDEPADELPGDTLDLLQARGLAAPDRPLKLHLGCGEQRLEGYVNIDYPAEHHNLMAVRPDFDADVVGLRFPAESVDEIRLHHLFEHFNRVTALALLIRWQRWLKPGGVLHLETPDLLGSARTLVSAAPLAHKLAAARHLAGDQAAPWAFHVDLWFPERFERTLDALGFSDVQITTRTWPHPPHLANVEARARRGEPRSHGEQLVAADQILWDSTVARVEQATWAIWRAQLRAALDGAPPPPPTAASLPPTVAERGPEVTAILFSKDRPAQLDATIRSLLVQCRDAGRLAIKVLYRPTSEWMRTLYRRVADELPTIELIEERDFRADLLAACAGARHLLFLVDDTLFVDRFSLGDAVDALARHPDALGYSFRLGKNVDYIYALDRVQPLPPFREPSPGLLAYSWKSASLAFAYPLEVSSSLYRGTELLPLLERLAYQNPNTLEQALSEVATPESALPPDLLCPARSVAFSAPVNVVQSVFPNRAGEHPAQSTEALAAAFAAGDRIDVIAFDGFVPNGPHQEVELRLQRAVRPPIPQPAPPVPPAAPLPVAPSNGHRSARLPSLELVWRISQRVRRRLRRLID